MFELTNLSVMKGLQTVELLLDFLLLFAGSSNLLVERLQTLSRGLFGLSELLLQVLLLLCLLLVLCLDLTQ